MIIRKKINTITLTLLMISAFGISVFAAPDTTSDCDHSNTETIERYEPDCINPGYTAGVYCNDCKQYISGHKELKPIGHIDIDGDMKCDDCGTKFTINEEKAATCTSEGYSGDIEDPQTGRIIMGNPIPKLPHEDLDKDYFCDICHTQIPKDFIYITLHYYMTNEEYEKNREKLPVNTTVKDSESVPGCKYLVTAIKTKAMEEISVPEFPKLSRFIFQWQDITGAIYKRFVFNENTDIYMVYAETVKNTTKGQCGDNAYWKWLNEEKRLVFYGDGTLWDDWKRKADMPWYEYVGKSDRIVLSPGVTVRTWHITK